MNILHYSLGFPPYRSGGMTTFCVDLMAEQLRQGHKVSLLWPGEIKLLNRKVKIKKRKDEKDIGSFELVNPLPVALDEGITDIDRFIRSTDESVFTDYLKQLHPNVIHIHTFMGLYKEFLEAAKSLDIRLIFTSHDYYPLCPRVTLCRGNKVCNPEDGFANCPQCNNNALSMPEIMMLQSPHYRKWKESALVVKLRRWHRNNYWGIGGRSKNKTEENSKKKSVSSLQIMTKPEDYKKLRDYYTSMLRYIDKIHFNSEVAKNNYLRFVDVGDYEVITITHAAIEDKCKEKTFERPLKISYLGSASSAKGFFLLKQALDSLWEVRKDFLLNIWFAYKNAAEYMICHESYKYSELEEIFDNTDVVVVPSIWNETFGYGVIEALSHGVPVIVSKRVGAKDIIPEGCGIVIEKINKDGLSKVINELTPDKLRDMNRHVILRYDLVKMSDVCREISENCYIQNNL